MHPFGSCLSDMYIQFNNRGKVLDKEDATVAECAIEEKGFIVVFVTKPAKPAAEPSTATTATPPAPAASAAPPAATPDAAAPTAPAAAAQPTGAAFGSLLTGSALDTAVANICEMGFDREEVNISVSISITV